ncbi:MAG: hypothetical protein QM817_10195 [Archangium sp.]
MMFGTAASNAAAQAPAAPPPSSKQTMVFGSGAAAAPPPPAPNKNQTMMFGTPASNAASQAQQNAPPPNSKQTMVFGTGAAVPPPAPPPPSKNTTMMFGTPASNAVTQVPPPPANPPGSSAKTTIMFGGNQAQAPAAPAPSSKQTMVFGAPAQQPPAPARPASPPQRPTFGTAASNGLADAPADETILEAPGQSSRTMLFGTPTADAPNAGAPAKNQTMMFGRAPNIPKVTAGSAELAGMSADEGAPNESTVRVDNPSEDQEGAEPVAPARQDRTQRFAMTDLGNGAGATTPPAGRDPVQDRHNRTQLFAMSSNQESTAPTGESLDATLVPGAMRAEDMGTRPTMDLSSTLPPDSPLPALESSEPAGVSLLHDPANSSAMEGDGPSENEGLIATTLPNLGPVQGTRLPPLKLELPAEPVGSPQDFARPNPTSNAAATAEDAAAMRAARGGGAGRIVVIILAIVALGLAGVLVYRLFGDQIMAMINPPESHPVG